MNRDANGAGPMPAGPRPAPAGDAGEFSIRPATPDDISALAHIEQRCFAIPWSADALASELSDPERARVLVAIGPDGRVLGYISSWFILDEGEIHNIAVDPDQRGRGIGKALLDALIGLGRREGIASFTLEVRPSNAAALRLYAGLGFQECGRRRGYYANNHEDAIIMLKNL